MCVLVSVCLCFLLLFDGLCFVFSGLCHESVVVACVMCLCLCVVFYVVWLSFYVWVCLLCHRVVFSLL